LPAADHRWSRRPIWLGQLDFDWDNPVRRHWLSEFSRDHTLLRYDERGIDNQQIATRLFLSEKTVKNHITSIFDKLGGEHAARLQVSAGPRRGGAGGARQVDLGGARAHLPHRTVHPGAFSSKTPRRTESLHPP